MALPSFHLSIHVRSIDESAQFFERVLGATVTHRDPSGYVNVDLYNTQITLKEDHDVTPPAGFHFGVNLTLEEFDRLAEQIASAGTDFVGKPAVVDAGTLLERKKLYIRCPSGYLIELKGYGTNAVKAG